MQRSSEFDYVTKNNKRDLQCSACNLIAFKPKECSSCRKWICKECEGDLKIDKITKMKKCPNCTNNLNSQIIKNAKLLALLHDVKIKCPNALKGCDHVIKRDEIEEHLKVCEKSKASCKHYIGIDLGTTNSLVSVYMNNRIHVIPNRYSETFTPSVIFLKSSSDQIIVGKEAVSLGITEYDQRGLVLCTKRLIGTPFSKLPKYQRQLPYTVKAGENDSCIIESGVREIDPIKVASLILKELKTSAEDFLGCEVRNAVISVPAYFCDAQREATIRAAEIAGLKVERLVNEPTAAALCYHYSSRKSCDGDDGDDVEEEEKLYVVFDFGGGTLDITIVKFDFVGATIMGINGDGCLGGEDFDAMIMELMCDHLEIHGVERIEQPTYYSQLKYSAKIAKEKLSYSSEQIISFKSIGDDIPPLVLSRYEFEQMAAPLISRCKTLLLALLTETKMKPSDINDVILVGGSSRIPAVQTMIESIFNKPPSFVVHPDESIAVGCGVIAAMNNPLYYDDDDETTGLNDVLLTDITTFPIQTVVRVEDDSGYIVKGEFEKYVSDIKKKYRCEPMIPKFVPLPAENSKYFPLPGYTWVRIMVMEGESKDVNQNSYLGHFDVPVMNDEVTVTFAVNDSGVLTASAVSGENEGSVVINTSINSTAINKPIKVEANNKNNNNSDNNNNSKDNNAAAIVKQNYGVADLKKNDGFPEIVGVSMEIIDKFLHLKWKNPALRRNEVTAFIITINKNEHRVPVAKLEKDDGEYILAIEKDKSNMYTGFMQFEYTSNTRGPKSETIQVSNALANYSAKSVKDIVSSKALGQLSSLIAKVFNAPYGGNKSFWTAMKKMVKVMEAIKKLKKK